MEDFRVRVGFVDHPKISRLRRRVGGTAVEMVLRLWDFCTKARRDGSLHGMDAEDIADVCRWEGDPNVLLEALQDSGLIDPCDDGWCVHDWAEEQPWVAGFEQRSQRARAAAAARWGVPQKSKAKRKTRKKRKTAPRSANTEFQQEVRAVVDHYRTIYPERLKGFSMDGQLAGKIRGRLREGYSVAELCEAIDGLHQIPFNVEKGHTSLELIVRNGGQVDKYRGALNKPVMSEREVKGQMAAESWLRRTEQAPFDEPPGAEEAFR